MTPFSNVLFFLPALGKGVQMQRDVQCCMLYSQGKVRTKDVLRFEVQTEGPDCSIQAIMQVFQISTPGAKRHTAICRLWKICLLLEEGRAGAAADCHLSRSCCYGRARGCNCQGSKKGNMRGITSHRQNTFRAEQCRSHSVGTAGSG